MALTLNNLYEEVAIYANLDDDKAKLVVDTIFNTMTTYLKNKEDIMIHGFGSLYLTPVSPNRALALWKGRKINHHPFKVCFTPTTHIRQVLNPGEPPDRGKKYNHKLSKRKKVEKPVC